MVRTVTLVLTVVIFASTVFGQAPGVSPTATAGRERADDSTLKVLADHAFLTGKVDNPKRIAEITKLGMSHWTTGDETSYAYTLASYMDEQPYPDIASNPAWLEKFLTLDEIREYCRFFDGSYEHFNLTPEDIDEIYGKSDLELFAAQTNVCVPIQDPVTGQFRDGLHTNFDQRIVPRILAHDVALTLDLGATNNHSCPGWDFKFAYEHPLITKVPFPLAHYLKLRRNDMYLFRCSPDPNGVEERHLFYPVLNPGSPAYIKLLRENIESRITAFPKGTLDYVSVNGEFFFRYPTKFDYFMDIDITPANYMTHLPLTDYSTDSLAFFSEWLKQRYSSLESLNKAWKSELKSFSDVDPRMHATHNVPFYDWVKFQVDQQREFDYFQYRIAKQTQPELDAYNLTFGGLFNLDFTEFGYFRSSDGISSGDWYLDDSPKDQPLKMVERVGRAALTAGEAFHFPFFGFPHIRELGPRYGKDVLQQIGQEPDETFKPPTYHEAFSWQTLLHWIAFGAETASVGYWEVPTHWSFHYGDRTFLNNMAAFLKEQKPHLAFMTPWRAPIVISLGEGNESDLMNDMLERLTIQQAQYGVFKNLAVIEEIMWARSARNTVVSLFADVDDEQLKRFSEYAVAHDAQALVFVAGSVEQLDLSAYSKSAEGGFDKYTSEKGHTTVYRYTGAQQDVSARARQFAVKQILANAKGKPGGNPQPVTAEVVGDKSLPLNVYTLTDGIALAAVILNPNLKEVEVRVKSQLKGLEPTEDSQFTLPATGYKLVYFANQSQLVAAACKQAGEHLMKTKRRVRQLKSNGYNVDAAVAILSYVDEAGDALSPQKKLAAAVRIQRMVFANVSGDCKLVETVGIEGRPLQGVPVQLQFPLQFNARIEAGVTDATGSLRIDPTPPEVKVWDFEQQEYRIADDRLVRFRFQHPRYLTETTAQHLPTSR